MRKTLMKYCLITVNHDEELMNEFFKLKELLWRISCTQIKYNSLKENEFLYKLHWKSVEFKNNLFTYSQNGTTFWEHMEIHNGSNSIKFNNCKLKHICPLTTDGKFYKEKYPITWQPEPVHITDCKSNLVVIKWWPIRRYKKYHSD